MVWSYQRSSSKRPVSTCVVCPSCLTNLLLLRSATLKFINSFTFLAGTHLELTKFRIPKSHGVQSRLIPGFRDWKNILHPEIVIPVDRACPLVELIDYMGRVVWNSIVAFFLFLFLIRWYDDVYKLILNSGFDNNVLFSVSTLTLVVSYCYTCIPVACWYWNFKTSGEMQSSASVSGRLSLYEFDSGRLSLYEFDHEFIFCFAWFTQDRNGSFGRHWIMHLK